MASACRSRNQDGSEDDMAAYAGFSNSLDYGHEIMFSVTRTAPKPTDRYAGKMTKIKGGEVGPKRAPMLSQAGRSMTDGGMWRDYKMPPENLLFTTGVVDLP